MSYAIRDLIRDLPADPWRDEVAFSSDIAEATGRLMAATTGEQREEVVSDWLQRHQPCLFGRVAAALGLVHYCILTPTDLAGEDENIHAKIQAARLEWYQAGWDGHKSGFVVLALSEGIARARPGHETKRLAQRLCSLYLQTEVEPDHIYWDDLRLQYPVEAQESLQWRVGVNYFCAQGDGRWWHDHRIPGGMAFSMNSVGHLVKSRALAERMIQQERALGRTQGSWVTSKLASREDALVYAMRTIAKAANAASGKATELAPLPADTRAMPKCPVDPLPPDLQDKNYCKYAGYYHTDITLPSEYFSPEVTRPASATRRELDFTYLFDSSISNLDYFTMGAGVPIRDVDGSEPSPFDDKTLKTLKSVGRRMSVADVERFIAYLYGR